MPIETRHRRPCGPGFCPAATRLVWSFDYLRLVDCAATIGLSPSALIFRAQQLSLPPHIRAKNKPKAPLSAIRAAWLDEATTLPVLAKRLGMSDISLRHRAMILGLPKRKGAPKRRYFFSSEFKDLWMAGVLASDIAAIYGCCRSTVCREARLLGLPSRDPYNRDYISIGEYREKMLAHAMAVSARAEQDAMILSEMVDKRRDNLIIGSEKAVTRNAA